MNNAMLPGFGLQNNLQDYAAGRNKNWPRLFESDNDEKVSCFKKIFLHNYFCSVCDDSMMHVLTFDTLMTFLKCP